MKAPSVREGSKENGTQVTGRRSPALQEPIRKNSPGVDHVQETGTDPLKSRPDTRKFAANTACIGRGYFLTRRVSGVKGKEEVIASEVRDNRFRDSKNK
jgi:hypothetical protein